MMHDLLRHKLDRIARELGTVVTYRDVEDQYSTWKEIHYRIWSRNERT